MRWRVDLEPVKTITQTAVAQTITQQARFAKRIGHGANGQAFINVYRNSIGGTVTFDLDTISNIEAQTTSPGSASALWLTVAAGKTIAASTVGVAHFTGFSKLGEWIRWRVTTPASAGSIDFDVVIFFEETR